MATKTESELLELAEEVFALLREAKEYTQTVFFLNWDTERKLQDRVWLKVAEFEWEYAKARRDRKQVLYFAFNPKPPLIVTCQPDEQDTSVIRQRAKALGYREINETAYQEALAEWKELWKNEKR